MPSLARRISGDAAWVLLSRLVISGSSVVIITMLSRLMPIEEIGQYLLLVSLITGLGVFSIFGMDNTSVREIAKHRAMFGSAPSASWINVFFVFTGVALSVACVAVYVLESALDRHFFKSEIVRGVFVPFCLWLVFLVFTRLTAECFRGMRLLARASLLGEALGAACLIVTVGVSLWMDVKLNLSMFVWMVVVAYGVSAVVGFVVLQNSCSRESLKEKGKRVLELLSSGGQIMFVAVVSFFISQLDLWFLASFFTSSEVAVYGVVLRVIALVSIPLLIVNLSLQPYIPEMIEAGEKEKLERLLRRVSALLLVPSAVVLSILAMYGGAILGRVFGSEYSIGAGALTVLTVAKLAQIASGSCGTLLIMAGHQKDLFKISIANAFLLIVLLFILVKPYGMLGCALATAIIAVTQNLAMLFVAKARTNIWTCAATNFGRSCKTS